MSPLGEARRARLARSRLYLVTGARRPEGDLERFLNAVLGAGVDIVQLREKEAEAGDVLRWSSVFRAATHQHEALFIVNDRPDVALAAGADGVHVGQNDLPAAWARRVVGADAIVGLSTHTASELVNAPAAADYVCIGPVHETPTKPGRPATGLELVREAGRLDERGATGSRPWFAIGGIDERTLPSVIAAGARRIVVVRAITDAMDPEQAAAALARLMRSREIP